MNNPTVDGRSLKGPSEQLQESAAIDQLVAEFSGVDRTAIERLYADSLRAMGAARISAFTPVLAGRLTRERLRALATLDDRKLATTPSVLFLCVHNAGRSQMATGWFRHLAGGRAAVYSGGSEPAADLNAAVIETMHEVGISIEDEFPKPWTDEVARAVNVIVTMGCGDECPVYPGVRVLDWEIDDPAGQDVAAVRMIRDDIERRVRALLIELGVHETNTEGERA